MKKIKNEKEKERKIIESFHTIAELQIGIRVIYAVSLYYPIISITCFFVYLFTVFHVSPFKDKNLKRVFFIFHCKKVYTTNHVRSSSKFLFLCLCVSILATFVGILKGIIFYFFMFSW